MTEGADRLSAAIALIDQSNGDDPNMVPDASGALRPKEVVHAERVTEWLNKLVGDPSEAQLLAGRAHHLRRWEVQRSDFPEGRAGYLKWRRERKAAHAELVGEIMESVGYTAVEIERVGAIVRKEELSSDAEVQHHEDALCLTFFELQSVEVVGKLGHDRAVPIVARTLGKMSPGAVEVAAALDLGPDVAAVVAAAAAEQ